jgi:hypothetical protein
MKKIIVLTGRARSGKDTLADCLVFSNEFRYKKISFAESLRELTVDMFNLEIDDVTTLKDQEIKILPVDTNLDDSSLKIIELYNSDIKNNHWTGRGLLRLIGTVMRCVNKNYWIDQVIDKINQTELTPIITDCRYVNEYNELKKRYDVKLYYIENKKTENTVNINHSSEQEIDILKNLPECVKIENNGSLYEYTEKIKRLFIEHVH